MTKVRHVSQTLLSGSCKLSGAGGRCILVSSIISYEIYVLYRYMCPRMTSRMVGHEKLAGGFKSCLFTIKFAQVFK